MILGPFGEGYCTTCRFIEPLDPDGRVAQHWHNQLGEYGRERAVNCKGSRRKPPKVTPRRSWKSIFRTKATGNCPVCGVRTGLELYGALTLPTVGRHRNREGSGCPGWGTTPA